MFLDDVVLTTEKILTWRKRRIMRKKKKQALKTVARDWIEAFLWAAGVVLLINQYLFQAYAIPSGSMEDTLLIKDHIFVNKAVYGPEILPGIGKIAGFKNPQRGDVFIFENPEYVSKGTAFDIAQRVIYMLTLSMVDIDRDPVTGQPSHHFLIKRTIGVPGDRLRLIDGKVQLKPSGFSDWMPEKEFKEIVGLGYPTKRLLPPDYYNGLVEAAAKDMAENAGLTADLPHLKGARTITESERHEYSYMIYYSREAHAVYPYDLKAASAYYRGTMGWYIPQGWYMPLGDNRDNSKDGRYFGLVSKKKVLGEAEFKYWPLNRFGTIR